MIAPGADRIRLARSRRLGAVLVGVLVAFAMLDAFAAGAALATEAEAPPRVARRLPPTVQPAPAPVLERLPPNARPAAERGGVERRVRPYGPAFFESVGRAPSTPGGLRVEYTVDPDLEHEIRRVLELQGVALGHVLLLHPTRGEVFAYVSTDPETFPPTGTYPTASLMKVVTAAAVLRTAPEAAERTCRYEGSPYELRGDQLDPDRGGREQSFERAIAISNNQCFAQLAVHALGEDALLREIRTLGLLDAPAPGHPAGYVEPLRSDLDLGELGSGLAGSFITPLGAARLAAALAEGELVEPFWIARIRDASGAPLRIPRRQAPRRIWSQALTDELREAMVEVTEEGTARRGFRDVDGARLGPIRVSGKTGTLSGRDPEGRYQWFVGVAPASSPRIAVAAVVVERPPVRTRASRVAAEALAAVFCRDDRCDPAHAEPLHARAAARAAEDALERAQRRHRDALARAFETAAAHEVVDLDRPPRPLETTPLDLPRSLRRDPARGRVVLLVTISETGEVLDVRVDSSDLPEFDEHVARAVKAWRFTPPTRDGRPVEAVARLPIPIEIE